MITLHIEDMTCGHCAGVITRAVQAVAPAASVQIDLSSHTVQIDGAGSAPVEQAIRDAGYTPVPATAQS